jgi:hypothetical protein
MEVEGELPPCTFTLKTTDFLQIKSDWDAPSVNNTPLPGMVGPTNVSTKQTINSSNYTKTQNDQKGYLTSVPAEYITETELNNEGCLSSVPAEYITQTELSTNNIIIC